MPRLQDPETRSVVSVDDEYAKVLRDLGWKAPQVESKPATRKTADK